MIDDPARSAGGTLGEYAYANEAGRERSMGDVVKDIIANVQGMMRSEVRLAKAEFREEMTKTTAAAKLMGIGAGLALFGAGFVLAGITLLLALVVPAWVAALLVGAALAIPGAVLLSKGKSQMTLPKPQKTIENVKENVEWMKNQTKS
jgi:uncharacterized membrane protein YqjE